MKLGHDAACLSMLLEIKFLAEVHYLICMKVSSPFQISQQESINIFLVTFLRRHLDNDKSAK